MSPPESLFVLAGLLFACGCTGTNEKPEGCGAEPGVCVLLVDDYELDGVHGTRTPDHAGEWSVHALVITGSVRAEYPGGWVHPDGHLDILDVPEGPYMLEIVKQRAPDFVIEPPVLYLVTSERALDLGRHRIGRADVDTIEQGTTLRIEGALSTPWAEPQYDEQGMLTSATSDRIDVYSRGAGVFGTVAGVADGSAPVLGETALAWSTDAKSTFESLGGPANAIDGTRGDTAVVARQRRDHLFASSADAPAGWGGAMVDHIVDVQTPKSFTMTSGSEAGASGDFQAGGEKVTFDLVYSASALASVAQAVGTTTDQSFTFTLAVEPGTEAPSSSVRPLLAKLTAVSDIVPVGLADLTRTLEDTNPFHADAILLASYSASFGRRVPNPADGNTDLLTATVEVSGKAADWSGKAFTPGIGLVQNPTVDDKPAGFADIVDGVGTSNIVVSWDPPSGEVGHYVVTLYDQNDTKDDLGNPTGSSIVATFRTTDTEITIPGDTLQEGHYYSCRIAVHRREDGDNEAAPYRRKSYASASSVLSTGLFTP